MGEKLDDWQAAATLARDCKQAAEFYEANPGLAGARTDIDLYRALNILADIVARATTPPPGTAPPSRPD
jgi:hypothetical protein